MKKVHLEKPITFQIEHSFNGSYKENKKHEDITISSGYYLPYQLLPFYTVLLPGVVTELKRLTVLAARKFENKIANPNIPDKRGYIDGVAWHLTKLVGS